MRQVVSLWLPRFATDLWLRRHFAAPDNRDPASRAVHADELREARDAMASRPLALVERSRGSLVLGAVNGAAESHGLTPGRPLSEAQALVPDLTTGFCDPEGDARQLLRLARWCDRFSPLVALAAQGDEAPGAAGLWLDVTGVCHLFGGPAALLADLERRLEDLGLQATAALAPTPGAAWALARFGTSPLLEKKEKVSQALAPLPPAALRLSASQRELLARFGLNSIGKLYALPTSALTRRFGPSLILRLDQALGRSAEPLSPHRPQAPLILRDVFAEPVFNPDFLSARLAKLLERLCRRLDKAGQGARRLELRLYRVDGGCQTFRIGTSRPRRDAGHLARLFATQLEKLDAGFGIEVMTLAAPACEDLAPQQASLPDLACKSGGHRSKAARAPSPMSSPIAGLHDDLPALIDRLAERFGAQRIWRPAPREAHLPEQALRRLSPLSLPTAGAWQQPQAPWQRPRPLRLLSRPQELEATALLPDCAPAQFRWRGLCRRVAQASGPERILPPWWAQKASGSNEKGSLEQDLFDQDRKTRDYFQVSDREGRRYWLYRKGVRWYLQGLFG
jgi:protein ImuB